MNQSWWNITFPPGWIHVSHNHYVVNHCEYTESTSTSTQLVGELFSLKTNQRYCGRSPAAAFPLQHKQEVSVVVEKQTWCRCPEYVKNVIFWHFLFLVTSAINIFLQQTLDSTVVHVYVIGKLLTTIATSYQQSKLK